MILNEISLFGHNSGLEGRKSGLVVLFRVFYRSGKREWQVNESMRLEWDQVMPEDTTVLSPRPDAPAGIEKKRTPEAERALAEAAQRRALYDAQAKAAKPVLEINGREGPEAIRYGDWENKGIASDF